MCCEDSTGGPQDVLQVCAIDSVRCSALGPLNGVIFRGQGAKMWPASPLACDCSALFLLWLYIFPVLFVQHLAVWTSRHHSVAINKTQCAVIMVLRD